MSSLAPPTPKTTPDRVDEVPRTLVKSTTDGAPQVDPSAKPSTSKTRVDWKEEEFIRTIEQHGKHVVWRKALLCPCHNLTDGQAQLNCPNCDGSGFFYIDPITIRALMLNSDKHTKLYEKFGLWLSGETAVTVEPQYRLGHRDSIEMRDTVMLFSEVLMKGNRRGRRSKLPTNVDSARYRIASVVHLFRGSSETGNSEAIDSILSLECGVHFTISEDGWLEWTSAGNAAVPDETVLSIRYEFHPVYIIESFPHAHRDDVSGRKATTDRVIAHPIQAAAKLDYLLDVNEPYQAPTTG